MSQLVHRGLTLIELMVVLTVLTVTVGVATVRLDGLSEVGRLRAAGRQIGMFYRTARVQAITSGQPRVMEYPLAVSPKQEQKLRLLKPVIQYEQVTWQGGDGFRLTGGVEVIDVVEQRQDQSGTQQPVVRIRLEPDGMGPAHAVILGRWGQGRAVVILNGISGDDEFSLIDDPGTFDGQTWLDNQSSTGPDLD